MKKQLSALALIAVVLAIGASSTVAYFTALYTADNVVSVSGISVAIVETVFNQETQSEEPYTNAPVQIMPGASASRIIRAVNDGPEPIWVRIKVDVSFAGADGDSSDYVSIDYNTSESDKGYWTLKDGCYYYSEILEPGNSSEPLFTQVKFSEDMDNTYMNGALDMDIYCSAVQSANNQGNTLPYPAKE